MRLLTWNLLNGGQDPGSRERLARVVRVVRRQRPTIALLQEARGFDADGSRLLHELERALDMRGFLAVAQTGYHVAAYVDWAQRVECCAVETHGFHHALLRLGVRLSDGRTRVHVLGAHLCPHGSERRVIEAQRLASFATEGEHVLLAGDLNSLDHYADHGPALASMPVHRRVRYTVPGRQDTADTRVTETLEAAGFVDLGHRFAPRAHTIPTKLPAFGAGFAQLRLDYVYATRSLARRATGLRVIRGGLTERASDHYPIVAELDVGGEA